MRAKKFTKAKKVIFLSMCVTALALGGCSKAPKVPDKAIWTGSMNVERTSEAGGSAQEGDTDQISSMETTGQVYSQTIMVYMVGSDLESRYGGASSDLLEMMEAQVDTDKHNIVVYAGGASEWQSQGLSDEEDTILELDDGEFQAVETYRPQNMGKAKTLSKFVSYCLENYDTDKYSLICWDHGGGPVLGFGLDENHRDMLSLEEIQSALDKSVGEAGVKLEWIGFDACLMSSLEVADVLAPYADYMIASQETEPGWGWNYEFLTALSKPDMDGARLGQEIIDAYMSYGDMVFAVRPSLYADLTLSCVDLNRYQAVEDEMNQFFRDMRGALDTESFPGMVRNRGHVKDFGSYASDFNYSLVDAANLLEVFSEEGQASAKAAVAAIDEMVVYTRANVEDAGGISICYPYQTEEDYAEYYAELQAEVDFASDYADFLKNFNAIKNGDALIEDWDVADAEVDVEEMEPGQGGLSGGTVGSDISLALTPEQQANFGSAGYFILCHAKSEGYITDEEDERADEMYFFIHYGQNVEMDENGVLHAYYNNNAVYMQDGETGELSEVPMMMIEVDSTPEEQRYFSYVVLQNWGEDFTDTFVSDVANLQVAISEEYPDGIIRSAVPVSDDEDMQNPSKQLLNLEDYCNMGVTSRCSYVTRDENGHMKQFYEWEDSGWLMGFEQDLTKPYNLKVCPLQNPENYACMFVVKDAQGNLSMSELIPLGK